MPEHFRGSRSNPKDDKAKAKAANRSLPSSQAPSEVANLLISIDFSPPSAYISSRGNPTGRRDGNAIQYSQNHAKRADNEARNNDSITICSDSLLRQLSISACLR
jgi:hypothetical protein